MLVVSIEQFSYGKKLVLQGVHMELPPAQIIGLVAPNGTGKSTLVRIISGHLSAVGTQVTCNGKTYDKDRQYMRKEIVKMPDQADLYDELTGLQHLHFYASMWGVEATYPDKVVELLQMQAYIHQKVGTYSLGMRQRLCFALVVVTRASYMLLDEVMNGLDPDNVTLISNILKELREQGTSMIIASHLLDNLDSIADRVYFIKDQHFPIIYHPQEKGMETLLLSFASEQAVQAFVEQYGGQLCVNEGSCQIAIQLEEETANVTDLLNWAIAHLAELKEIKVGKKGSHLIYQELYRADRRGG